MAPPGGLLSPTIGMEAPNRIRDHHIWERSTPQIGSTPAWPFPASRIPRGRGTCLGTMTRPPWTEPIWMMLFPMAT